MGIIWAEYDANVVMIRKYKVRIDGEVESKF